MKVDLARPPSAHGPDEWLARVRRSIEHIGSTTTWDFGIPVSEWDHTGAYMIARAVGAPPPDGSAAFGILFLTAIGTPRPLVNDELLRLRLWDGATQPLTRTSPSKGKFFRREPVPIVIDKLGDAWHRALAQVPRPFYRVNRESRFGAIYCGPKWWTR